MAFQTILLQNGWQIENRSADSGVYFRDGERKIDMVLAFEDQDEESFSEENSDPDAPNSTIGANNSVFVKTINQQKEGEKRSAREIFEQNILFSGLSIEYEYKNVSKKKYIFYARSCPKMTSPLRGEGDLLKDDLTP